MLLPVHLKTSVFSCTVVSTWPSNVLTFYNHNSETYKRYTYHTRPIWHSINKKKFEYGDAFVNWARLLTRCICQYLINFSCSLAGDRSNLAKFISPETTCKRLFATWTEWMERCRMLLILCKMWMEMSMVSAISFLILIWSIYALSLR